MRVQKGEHGGEALEQDLLDWEMRSFVYAHIVERGMAAPLRGPNAVTW